MKTYQYQGSSEVREQIGKAVFSLLKEKPIDKIRIGEVSDRAYIGRTTFYRYYGTKGGLEEALLDYLYRGWEKKGIKPEDPLRDKAFLTYLYEIKEELLLLKKNRMESLLFRLIQKVFAPNEKETDYFSYLGTGLWLGLSQALLDREFKDSIEEVERSITEGFKHLASLAQSKEESEKN